MYYWTNELWRLAYLVIGLGVLGWLFGAPGWGLAAGLGLYVYLHLRHLRALYVWLTHHPHHTPPVGAGVWGDLFDRLYKYQKIQRQSQARLRDIIRRVQDSCEAMRDAVVMLDSHGDLEWWNSAATQMLGFQSPHDRGQHITNFLRDPRFVAYFNDRDYREPLTLASPLRDDVTLQYQVTLFGDNERLVMARDISRLHRLEEMRRDFVANVSHELRTPLTVLTGYLETYLDQADQLPSRWQRGLGQMQEQTQRMQNLVEDLLLLSKLETDQTRDDPAPLDMATLLENIRDDAANLCAGSHEIALDIHTGHCLLGDEGEMRSAISNLVFNAVRYTPAGSTVTLRWKAWKEGAAVEVEDDGEGIDPVHLPRLTERFYRVDKGRSAANGGTGLGLAIVKHVLLRHDAHLDIDSHPGQGALFRCVFPATRVRAAPEERRAVGGD
ncbi:phosphate regulon sensor histidine kinase PhoR [Chromohalobacter canadensis]|uniref:phosphate regulon sensor histidine kinase PhoR n=1 Tax=Chromohalobacter canadensis TaxID=141389 RepID=UPI0021C0B6D1|nr:phosphate regulon sensor histidine kinase PhoR [Chromohalobacter canadensis]MCT8469136.1 phosphate regulon sensor histidine kinase PhoR [Chromohalobacter canadensis]MCT8472674.1 phosphate regulon sensor histidine kinase PhoR [Chromohalobacter canadensis]MCT8500127.1 phosphate regulon sensor histidine kinase PhoR [Chromohalobacter canadensis]